MVRFIKILVRKVHRYFACEISAWKNERNTEDSS